MSVPIATIIYRAATLTALFAFSTLPVWPNHAVAQQQQSDDTGASKTYSGVYGIAIDSIHGGPLSNAVVRLDKIAREARTDAKGYYRIDSVPPGTYRVSLYHPILDTLGMTIGTVPIEFPAGRVPIVPLGTPSDTAMLDIACSKMANPEGPVALLGVVRDPDTNEPAVGAQVTLTWIEVSVSKVTGARRARRRRDAIVDSLGNYAICGLPADMGGTLQATRNGASTAGVDVQIGDVSLVALRSLSLGASQVVIDTVDGIVRQLQRGPASLRGRVIGVDGAAISGAQVDVPGTPQRTISSQSGAFSLIDLPAGTEAVLVRGIGYAPAIAIVELSATRLYEVTVTLTKHAQVLAPLEAEAAAAGLDRVGFTERQRLGLGRYITREDIDKRVPFVLTDVFTTVPGIRMAVDRAGNQVLQSTRASPNEAGGCTTIFVDRMPLRPVSAGQLVSHLNLIVRPEDVQGIEVYQANQVPGEFMLAGERCMTVVIWTRASVGEKEKVAPSR